MKSSIEVCILAAGKGSRMKSDRPKALQLLAGQPLLSHILKTTTGLGFDPVNLVIGSGGDQIRERIDGVNFVEQTEQLGTGHAVQQVLPFLTAKRVLILVGDIPLISTSSLQRLVDATCDLGVLTVDHPNPFNYGRIVRDADGIERIVEERDANEEQRRIQEINTGVMVADAALLSAWVSNLSNDNDQKEYLLTDIVAMARADGCKVAGIKADDYREVLGVNNYQQLAELEKHYQQMNVERLQQDGVQIIDPDRFILRGELKAGRDVLIDANCIIEGDVKLGDGVQVGANTVIKDASIGAGTIVKPFTHIDGAVIESDCSVGPFSRLRPGTHFEPKVAVGNFVEVKKSRLGAGTKASHLSYLGDATIGSEVNIGAGAITCNYDGVNKYETQIEDGVFVGVNVAMVAPVTIGEWSTIAAGSTITTDVPGRTLGVGRGKQRNIEGWKGPRDK